MGGTAAVSELDLLIKEDEMRKILQESRQVRDLSFSKKPKLSREEANDRYPLGQRYVVVQLDPRPMQIRRYDDGLCGWPLYQMFCETYGDGNGYRLVSEAELDKLVKKYKESLGR